LLAHAEPDATNKILVDPWLKLTHPGEIMSAYSLTTILSAYCENSPEGSLGVRGSSWSTDRWLLKSTWLSLERRLALSALWCLLKGWSHLWLTLLDAVVAVLGETSWLSLRWIKVVERHLNLRLRDKKM
jgi:hypothetical protein